MAKATLTFAVYQGNNLQRRETVSQDIVKVGKDPKSHLQVDDDQASRMHAVIEVGGPDDITLIDLGNEPGTMVNGARVNKCKLHVNDEIQVGGTRIILESAGASGVEAAVRSAPPPPLPPTPRVESSPLAAPSPESRPAANPFAPAAPAENPFAAAGGGLAGGGFGFSGFGPVNPFAAGAAMTKPSGIAP